MLDYYIVPKCKREQLFDFYALTMFSPRCLTNEDDIDYFTRAKQDIINHNRNTFINALKDSVSCELWHVPRRAKEYYNTKYNPNYDMNEEKFNDWLNVIKNTFTNKEIDFFDNVVMPKRKEHGDIKYDRRIVLFNKYFSDPSKIASLGIRSFGKLRWSDDFGGKNWYNISKALSFLIESRTINDRMVAVDHAYDLQHNTNTAFNKTPEFAIDGDYEWLKIALDKKYNLVEPHEILSHVSHQLRRPLARVFKYLYNKTYESYIEEDRIRKEKRIDSYISKLKESYDYNYYMNELIYTIYKLQEPYCIFIHKENCNVKIRRLCRKEFHESNGWIAIETKTVEQAEEDIFNNIVNLISSENYKNRITKAQEYVMQYKNSSKYFYYDIFSGVIIDTYKPISNSNYSHILLTKIAFNDIQTEQTELNLEKQTEKIKCDLEELPF